MTERLSAVLLLEDGIFFSGRSFGFSNPIRIDREQLSAIDTARLCGELCFNTGMSGYQEILSDPSYAGQIICFSFPHIGNVGCNDEDYESARPPVLGMVSREYPSAPSSWRSVLALTAWLERHRISGICGLDTRALIHHLRERGSKRALLGTVPPEFLNGTSLKPQIMDRLMRHLQASPLMSGQDLASRVTRAQAEPYDVGPSARWLPQETHAGLQSVGKKAAESSKHIAVLDLGSKENILKSVKRFAARVTVLPLQSCWQDIAALQPDGLVLSNGPGDPEPVYQKLARILERAFAIRLPILGICMGHQVLALSLGAKTMYMHHGHRGINHPVLNILRNTVEITSQNHGFCVHSLPPDRLEVTHRSLFDSCIEGIRSLEYPAFSVQYHPESSPGPHDSTYLFRDFIELMEQNPNAF